MGIMYKMGITYPLLKYMHVCMWCVCFYAGFYVCACLFIFYICLICMCADAYFCICMCSYFYMCIFVFAPVCAYLYVCVFVGVPVSAYLLVAVLFIQHAVGFPDFKMGTPSWSSKWCAHGQRQGVTVFPDVALPGQVCSRAGRRARQRLLNQPAGVVEETLSGAPRARSATHYTDK
jgi:hypothetical protein